MSNNFDQPVRPCPLVGDKYTCQFRTRTDGLNPAIRQLSRKHRRETHAGLIRPTKLCFTWANEMELAQGKCPQGYARTGLFLANSRARFSIGVCDLRARELGSVLTLVGYVRKLHQHPFLWPHTPRSTTQPPRGSGGEIMLVVDVIDFVARLSI